MSAPAAKMKQIVALDEGAVKTSDPSKVRAIKMASMAQCSVAAWTQFSKCQRCSRLTQTSPKKR